MGYTRCLRPRYVLLAFLSLLLAAGCTRAPESYPPPTQRSLHLEPWEVDPPFVKIDAVDVQEYVVKDINPALGGGGWCWTFERPELKFILNCIERQKFAADFAVVAATLTQTGPVTISCWINGRLLGKMYCPTPGDRHFEKPVPASWLSTEEYTRVVIQADKLFIAESDGAKLGFTLHSAGFLESCGKPSAF
jgi:hypothetical protein